jgi:DNA primase
MDDTSKYLIHAAITADGVVERSDVVGAIFGQTEGLLGDDLDLRDLQQSSKVGRIDVQIDSQDGQSRGTVTIASSLDKVETAILAASLETISRVGPCRADLTVTDIEDVRAAKRREVVERAKELLSDTFDESVMDSREILEEVRESVRVEDITEFAGLPAGPHVADSDAIVVVEGRADVLTLLKYGIKNAVAVEGTNVPEAVADLTAERTVTAFLDGDRGGELILRELAQVGDVDYVAFAPAGRSVEDLARHEVMSALRDKVAYESLAESDALPVSTEAGEPGDPTHPLTGSSATTESPAPQDTDGEPTPAGTDGGHATVAAPTETGSADPTTEMATSDGTTETATSDGTTETATSDATAAETTSDATVDVDTGSLDDGVPGTDADEPATAPNDDTASASEAGSDAVPAADADPAADEASDADQTDAEPPSLRDHVDAVEGTGLVRLLDADHAVLAETDVIEAFEAVESSDAVPHAVVLDGEVSQRLLDVAAQRGVEHLVGTSTGEFVKKPVGVRVRTAAQLRAV